MTLWNYKTQFSLYDGQVWLGKRQMTFVTKEAKSSRCYSLSLYCGQTTELLMLLLNDCINTHILFWISLYFFLDNCKKSYKMNSGVFLHHNRSLCFTNLQICSGEMRALQSGGESWQQSRVLWVCTKTCYSKFKSTHMDLLDTWEHLGCLIQLENSRRISAKLQLTSHMSSQRQWLAGCPCWYLIGSWLTSSADQRMRLLRPAACQRACCLLFNLTLPVIRDTWGWWQ